MESPGSNIERQGCRTDILRQSLPGPRAIDISGEPCALVAWRRPITAFTAWDRGPGHEGTVPVTKDEDGGFHDHVVGREHDGYLDTIAASHDGVAK